MHPKLRSTDTPPQASAFDVQDPPWYDVVEDWALRGIAWSGVVLRQLSGRRAAKLPGMLTYHRVAPNIDGLPRPTHNVTPARFRQQLSGLLRRGFTPWPLQQLLDHCRDGQAIPPRTFVVTFDDGFESVYSRAWPVLQELNIPATLFVTTAYIDSEQPFPFDEWGVELVDRLPSDAYRPLTLAQCREMVDSGLMSIGAHTHTHQDFRGRPSEFEEDLRTSVEIVRDWFALQEVPFAFPFGSPRRGHAGPVLADAAKATEVTCGLTTDPVLVDLGNDPFTWGRFNAFSWDTAATLAVKLDGWYSWAPRLKRRVHGIVHSVLKSVSR